MKSIIKIAICILALTVLTPLHSMAFGPEITRKTLELSEFQSIYLNSNYTVYLKQSNKQEVKIEVLTEIYSLSEFKVENGILHINIQRKKTDPNSSIWSKIDDIKIAPTMNIYISMRDISQLKVNGGGKIISENSLASNKLDLAVTGSGSMNLDLKGSELTTKISGSGSVTLKGYASNNSIQMSGAGSLMAYTCELENAQTEVSGSGTCEINVTNKLDAVVYGSGSVKHKGTTKTVVQKVYGQGVVDRAY
jgi:hypothetical protein